MSSLDIAAITGKNHADVMRNIRATLEQAEIGLSKFASSYRNAQNKEQPCYHLPRRECDLVISGYSVKYRLAIIDRWHQLESKEQSFLGAVADCQREAIEARSLIEQGEARMDAVIAKRDELINMLLVAVPSKTTGRRVITDDIRPMLELIEWPCRWMDAANQLTEHEHGPKTIGAAKTLLGRAIKNRVITLAEKGFYNLTHQSLQS